MSRASAHIPSEATSACKVVSRFLEIQGMATNMGYRFLDNEATADVAFEAWGNDLREVFKAAADAVVAVMVENPEDISPDATKAIDIKDDDLDLLLYNFLEQMVFLKDAEHFLGIVEIADVARSGGQWHVSAQARGERLDPIRHHQGIDVKAVTLHSFRLEEEREGWRAHIVLDI